jgi:hypothetical protein
VRVVTSANPYFSNSFLDNAMSIIEAKPKNDQGKNAAIEPASAIPHIFLFSHTTLEMTRRYTQALGFDDVFKRHVLASPVDRLIR